MSAATRRTCCTASAEAGDQPGRDLDELAGSAADSHEVLVELIGATTTHTGSRVRAELDRGRYPLGVKVSDEELAAVPLARHGFHGEWNYSMQPAADKPPPTPRSSSTTLEAY
jgi:Rhodopirellula transposase DDE domain